MILAVIFELYDSKTVTILSDGALLTIPVSGLFWATQTAQIVAVGPSPKNEVINRIRSTTFQKVS